MLAFGCVGLFNTVVTVATMTIVAQLGVGYVGYTLAGYIVGFVVSYAANGYFTFRVSHDFARVFARFAMINAGLLACIQALQYAFIEVLGFREFFVVPACVVAYTIAGFLLNRQFVFIRIERP
jgi:putative flippase GtrA